MTRRIEKRTAESHAIPDLSGTLTQAVEDAVAYAGAKLVASVPDVLAGRTVAGAECQVTLRPRDQPDDEGWTVTVSLQRGIPEELRRAEADA